MATADTSMYDASFYSDIIGGSQRSAAVVVPKVLELYRARSVIDVGCGAGTWLKVFADNGVADIWGVDGGVGSGQSLLIPQDRFTLANLAEPFSISRTFDLVVSLEVAEHLPPASADTFVQSLVRLGPVVMFSAAAPFQGGHHHVNEQWPGYWAQLFAGHNYRALDVIRPRVWDERGVSFWYQQNTLLYVREDFLEDPLAEELKKASQWRTGAPAIVHPHHFTLKMSGPGNWVDPRDLPLRKVLSSLPTLVRRALGRKMGRSNSKA